MDVTSESRDMDPFPATAPVEASVLGDMTAETFLRDHWQKRPLLIRQAIPNFRGLFQPHASGKSASTAARDAFLELATRKDVTSRLVVAPQTKGKQPGRWERYDGPFDRLDGRTLPKNNWSLLIHGIESHVPGGWELLRRFSFVPQARIDDLMVSYASPGGTVGPHDDLYDVFLLQGPGRRRWQVSTQADRTLDSEAAIKVLKSFVPEEEWLLEPGDILYLPPGLAHYGVSDEPCFTYSIGFLAPSHRELVQNFLGYLNEVLEEGIDPDALYEDPDLRTQENPLALSDAMVDKVAEVLSQVRVSRDMVGDFLGRLLTGRKLPESFAAPQRTLSLSAFRRRMQGQGRLELAKISRGLVRGDCLFLNGEAHHVLPQTLQTFCQLVQHRSLPLPLLCDGPTIELFHDFYRAGFLRIV